MESIEAITSKLVQFILHEHQNQNKIYAIMRQNNLNLTKVNYGTPLTVLHSYQYQWPRSLHVLKALVAKLAHLKYRNAYMYEANQLNQSRVRYKKYIPSPQGAFLVVMRRTLVGILTGPLTLNDLSLAPRTKSVQTMNKK